MHITVSQWRLPNDALVLFKVAQRQPMDSDVNRMRMLAVPVLAGHVVVMLVAATLTLLPHVESAFTSTATNPASTFTAANFFYTGPLYGWGDNTSGNIGLNNTTSPQTSPTQVGSATTWADLDTANNTGGSNANTGHTCAVRSDGTLWCWGENYYGQLGRGNTTDSLVPVKIDTATDWRTVAVAQYHSCAIKSTGTLWCTGSNSYGQAGLGATTSVTSFTQVGIDSSWRQLSATDGKTCATRTDDTLWCWGYNGSYQLGLGDWTNRTTPAPVGSAGWKWISGGDNYACGTQTDKTIWCWGIGNLGQLGLGDTTTKTAPTKLTTVTGRVFAGGWQTHTTFAISY